MTTKSRCYTLSIDGEAASSTIRVIGDGLIVDDAAASLSSVAPLRRLPGDHLQTIILHEHLRDTHYILRATFPQTFCFLFLHPGLSSSSWAHYLYELALRQSAGRRHVPGGPPTSV